MPTYNYAAEGKSQIGIGVASWAIFDDDDRKAVHLTYSLAAIRTL